MKLLKNKVIVGHPSFFVRVVHPHNNKALHLPRAVTRLLLPSAVHVKRPSNFFDQRRSRREEREEQERYKQAASRRKRQTKPSSSAPAPLAAPSKPPAVEPRSAKPPTASATSNPLLVPSRTVPSSPASFKQSAAVVTAPTAAHPRRDSSDSSRSSSADEVSDSDSASDSNSLKLSKNKSTMEKLLRDFGLDSYSEMLCEAGFDTPFKVCQPSPHLPLIPRRFSMFMHL